jgi:hypothetical protein
MLHSAEKPLDGVFADHNPSKANAVVLIRILTVSEALIRRNRAATIDSSGPLGVTLG